MRLLILKNNKDKSDYTASIHALLADIGRRKNYPVQFSASFDSNYPPASDAISFVTTQTSSFIRRLIEQQKLISFIKEYSIDLLIQHAGSFFKQKTIPQLLIVDDVEKLPAVKKISYSKIFLLTYSQFAKDAIAEKGFSNVVHVIPFVADPMFQPINWSRKQQVKIDYTEGREYFFVPNNFTNIDDILKLLKTFSAFKKWQQSSMKLVLAGKLYVPQDDWQEKLNTYKYREDVLTCSALPGEEKALLLARAYACIHLPKNDNNLLPLFQSIQCGTPIITFEMPGIQEYAADAVLNTAAGNYEALTQQMILIYKDESLREKMIEHCNRYAATYAKEKTMQALLNIIL